MNAEKALRERAIQESMPAAQYAALTELRKAGGLTWTHTPGGAVLATRKDDRFVISALGVVTHITPEEMRRAVADAVKAVMGK